MKALIRIEFTIEYNNDDELYDHLGDLTYYIRTDKSVSAYNEEELERFND